jgi:hypothetical protein
VGKVREWDCLCVGTVLGDTSVMHPEATCSINAQSKSMAVCVRINLEATNK